MMDPTRDSGAGVIGAGPASMERTSSPREYHDGAALSTPIERLLSKLGQVESAGDANSWTSLCPSHKDKRGSLSISLADDGRILLKCFAGCGFEKIVAAIGMTASDLAPTVTQTRAHLTLLEYSQVKKLPLDFLATIGLREVGLGPRKGERAVAIPYFSVRAEQVAVRYRLAMTGEMRFRWRTGSKPVLYGLQRLADARKRGFILLPEGESDTQTAWYHGWPAIGLPGASVFRSDWSTHFDGFDKIYVADEGDAGADAIRTWVAKSAIRDRVWFFRLDGVKDLNDLHCSDPDTFDAKLQAALDAAVPWTEVEKQRVAAVADGAWSACSQIAALDDILPAFSRSLASIGVAGEVAAGQLVYLCLTSRLLARPVSLVVRGPSAGGKNWLLDQVLAHFPPTAFFELTGLSEHALIYMDADLRHRVLVIYEAEGASGDFTSYLLRGILSKGEIRYQTVIKTDSGMEPLTIVREGPISLAMTTTRPTLHPENETRLLSIPITDSKVQTTAVFHELARTSGFSTNGKATLTPASEWIEFQTWLATQPSAVSLPFADALADLVPPAAIRLRRDFGAVLALVRTHALIHQATRERDAEGRIVADLDDYAIVADLLSPIISNAIGSTVPATIVATVNAVADAKGILGVSTAEVMQVLDVCRESARSRLATARQRGYVKNIETKRGLPARWVVADPLPIDQPVLPTVDEVVNRLAALYTSRGGLAPCTSARPAGVHLDDSSPGCRDADQPRGGVPTHTYPGPESAARIRVSGNTPQADPAPLHPQPETPPASAGDQMAAKTDPGSILAPLHPKEAPMT